MPTLFRLLHERPSLSRFGGCRWWPSTKEGVITARGGRYDLENDIPRPVSIVCAPHFAIASKTRSEHVAAAATSGGN